MLARVPFVSLPEAVVQRDEFLRFVLGPRIGETLLHDRKKLRIRAGLGQLDNVDAAPVSEVQQFEILLHLRVAGSGRDDLPDIGRDPVRPEVFQDAGTLVALPHIIAVHIFRDLDRIPDALIQMRFAEAVPFRAEFRFPADDRHEIPRE